MGSVKGQNGKTRHERSRSRSRAQSKISTRSRLSTRSIKAVKNIRKHGLAAIPTRYVVVLVAAFTNLLSYSIRTNFSVTIVAMVNVSSESGDGILRGSCPIGDGDHIVNDTKVGREYEGEFDWSPSLQGVVLGAYYYGYIFTNVNAGQLADWFGPKKLCGISILVSGALTLLTPVAAYWSVYAVIALRVLIGLVQGLLTPSLYTLLAYWVPQSELSTALALILVGGNIGTVITMPLSGFLSKYGFAGGWPSVFYVLGTAGCLCFLIWIYTIYDSPADHPRILGKELVFIQDNVNVTKTSGKKKKAFVPWGPMLKSPRFWTVAIAKFCNSWGNLVLMSKLPSYLDTILHLPIDENGLVNSAVYFTTSVSLLFFGYISDIIAKKRLLSKTVSRKVFETVAMIGAAVLMCLIPAVGCNSLAVIILLVSIMFILGGIAGGDSPIVADIAPDFSGTVYGATNALASCPGFLGPLYVGLILDNNDNAIQSWNIVFFTTSAIYVIGAVVFLFVSAKPEHWGRKRQGTMRSTIDARYAPTIDDDDSSQDSLSSIEEDPEKEEPKRVTKEEV